MKKEDLIILYDSISNAIELDDTSREEISRTLEFVNSNIIDSITLRNIAFHFVLIGLKTHAFITEQIAKVKDINNISLETYIHLAIKYYNIDHEFETCDTSKLK